MILYYLLIFNLCVSISRTMAVKTVLVTGGAGYIGSHCVVTLIEAGYNVVALDNFNNSVSTTCKESVALNRVERITNKKIIFYACDLLDIDKVHEIFSKHRIESVIHFAAMKGKTPYTFDIQISSIFYHKIFKSFS
jgi:nucleoside-diphosphate-sugar epimerase